MKTMIHVISLQTGGKVLSISYYMLHGGYFTFSVSQKPFFEYLGGGALFNFVDFKNSETGAIEKTIQYWDEDGVELYEQIGADAITKIVTANPAAIAKAIFKNITGKEYPGGDVTVVFSNNQ